MFLKESTEAGGVVNKNGGSSKVNVIENVTKNVDGITVLYHEVVKISTPCSVLV